MGLPVIFYPTHRILRSGRPGGVSMIDCQLVGSRDDWGSFCVTLRSQPRHLALSRQPLIGSGLAYEALDVPDFSPGTVGLNLPITIGDAFAGKDDAGRFSHFDNMRCAGPVFHPTRLRRDQTSHSAFFSGCSGGSQLSFSATSAPHPPLIKERPSASSGGFPPQSPSRSGLLILAGPAHSLGHGNEDTREHIWCVRANLGGARQGGAQASRQARLRGMEPAHARLSRSRPALTNLGRRAEREIPLSRSPVPWLRHASDGRPRYRRPKATPVHELERYTRCRNCSEMRGLRLQAKPSRGAPDHKDFGEGSALDVVARRA